MGDPRPFAGVPDELADLRLEVAALRVDIDGLAASHAELLRALRVEREKASESWEDRWATLESTMGTLLDRVAALERWPLR